MPTEARPVHVGVRQTFLRPHVDHQLVGAERLGGPTDQTFPEPVAAPSQLCPALLHRGERCAHMVPTCHVELLTCWRQGNI